MQVEKLQSGCRVGTCPALPSPKSLFGYCPIHDKIATDPDMYSKALAGKLNAHLKDVATQMSKGILPRRNF